MEFDTEDQVLSLFFSEGQGYSQKDTESLGWARLSIKSYKIEWFYFWQYVLWGVDLPPSYLDNVFKYIVCFLEITTKQISEDVT